MGTLKDRMSAELTRYGLHPSTRKQYLRYVELYAQHFNRSPATLGADDIEAYLDHLAKQEMRPRYFQRQVLNALKFFYFIVLERPEVAAHIQPPKKQGTIPDPLSPDDLDRLLLKIASPLYRTVLSVAMGGGLRLNEACRLELQDIDSKKMLLRLRSNNGAWPRFIPLHPETLKTLREWWRSTRPQSSLLFTREPVGTPLTPGLVQKTLQVAAYDCNLERAFDESVLRYSFFLHRLSHGAPPHDVKHLLRCIGIQPVSDRFLTQKTDYPFCTTDIERGVRI